MISDGSVEIGCGRVGYEIKRELGKLVDCIRFEIDQQSEMGLHQECGKLYQA